MNREDDFKGAAPIGVLKMKEAVASLIFLWSQVESELEKAIKQLDASGSTVPSGIGQRLERWKSLHHGIKGTREDHQAVVEEVFLLLSEALRIRNGICHGRPILTGNPHVTGAEAAITFKLNGTKETVPFYRLDACVDKMAGSPEHIFRLTHAAKHPKELRVQNLYDDVRLLIRRAAR